MAIRCPNFADEDTLKEFNSLVERLGGRTIREQDVALRRDYLKSLTPEEQSAYNRAHYYWNQHPTVKAIHSVLDRFDSLREAVSGERAAPVTTARTVEPGTAAAGQEPLFSRKQEPAPVWYSALARAVENVKQAIAPAQMWKSMIRQMPGVKQAEVEATGLNDWLDLQGAKVTKQQVSDFLKQGGVKVEEVTLGELPKGKLPEGWAVAENPDEAGMWEVRDAQGIMVGDGNSREAALRNVRGTDTRSTADTKFASYQLPGGTNYRELLLTLPAKRDVAAIEKEARHAEAVGDLDAAMRLQRERLAATSEQFKSGHFDQPNILAHIRFNERTDATGAKVLFIEEIQSDWAQKGKKEGFKSTAARDAAKSFDAIMAEKYGGKIQARDNLTDTEYEQREALYKAAGAEEKQDFGGAPPSAPFVTKTEAWVALSLKRMIRYAAENGFDKVAWTNGEQQAGRYDLSKQIARVEVSRARDGNFGVYAYVNKSDTVPAVQKRAESEAELTDIVGKDLAAKIIKQMPGTKRDYTGLDLKVGGEGMKAFYDKIVPNVANDVLKKLGGGRVEDITGVVERGIAGQRYEGPAGIANGKDLIMPIVAGEKGTATMQQQARAVRNLIDNGVPFGEAMRREGSAALAELVGGKMIQDEKVGTQQGFAITPEMRDKAMQGMPLFAKGTGTGITSDTLRSEDLQPNEANREKTDALQSALNAQGYNFKITPTALPDGVADGGGERVNDAGTSAANRGTVSRGITEQTLRSEISKAFGPKAERLVGDLLVPLETQAEIADRLPNVAKHVKEGDVISGFHDPVTGKTYAILENLKPEDVRGVVMHEIGVHHGFEGMLGEDRYAQVLRQMDVMRKAGNKAVIEAHEQATKQAANESQIPQETVAYLVTNRPELPFVRNLISEIKAFVFRKFGILGDKLTADDIATLARASVLKASESVKAGEPQFARSEDRKPFVGSELSGTRLASERKRIEDKSKQRDQTQTPEFKQWFGASVVTENGKPGGKALRVYHGTADDVNAFDLNHPNRYDTGWLGTGVYLTTSSDIAHSYSMMKGGAVGSNVMPLYAKLENPYYANIGDKSRLLLVSTKQGKDAGRTAANAWTKELKARGHDGVILEYKDKEGKAIDSTEIVVFDPAGVKSAIGNTGAFDATNPDIRFQRNVKTAEGVPGKEEESKSYEGPGAALLASSRNYVGKIVDDLMMKVAPMSVSSASEPARAVAKDYANAERLSRWQWSKFDDTLKKFYTPEQRRGMWEAAQEQNELLLKGEDPAGKGLDKLPADQRKTMDTLHQYGEDLLKRAKAVGMFEGEGVPYWAPRMAVLIGGDGEFMRPPSGIKGESGSSEGRNITTTAPSLKARKYDFLAESESALKAKLGEQALYVRDIRTMPLAMARLERAIAGRELVDQIKALGKRTGMETVSTSEGANFFTLDHPAFKTYRPHFVEEGGKTRPAVDQNGDMVFDRIPVYISKDFEGPLKAIMSEKPGAIYSGFMSLKSKTMSMIMYSPLIHNAVEWGRALPMMPGKVATFKIYFEGNAIKNDPVQMRQAIADGMVPIGHRYAMQDITGLMEEPTLLPGRSWTAKLIGGAVGAVNEKAGTAVKKGIDTAGDVWHNTLLWDRVGDLQAGLYGNIKSDLVKKGMDPDAAGKIAAHFANRYAGALPNESMSANARALANFVFFSRSFTLGNLGVMKDMVTGLPKDVQAQLKTDIGRIGLSAARGYARRKAVAVFMVDVGLMYLGNSLLQDAMDSLKRDKSLSDIEQSYVDRFQAAMQKVRENPMALASPFGLAESLTSTSENEPDKEGRIHYGDEEGGTAVYLRMPTGKIGEEFKGWVTNPLDMVSRKEGTMLRPLMQTLSNDKGFGRRVFDPEAEGIGGLAKNVGRIVANFFEQQIPLDSATAAYDMAQGKATETDKMKALGPLGGVTFSHGAPGGPAVGEMYYSERKHRAAVSDIMPSVRRAIKYEDINKARELMESVDMTPAEISNILRREETPESRLNKGAIKRFQKHATEEEKQRFDTLRR